MNNTQNELSFFARLPVAIGCFFRVLGDGRFAARLSRIDEPASPVKPTPAPVPATAPVVPPAPAPAPKPAEIPPERLHAHGLNLLAMLQREGRLIDFLQEDLAAYGDADIGASARAVHAGCRKVLAQCLTLEPVLKDSEGAGVSVPAGFDANRIRLTGNVAGAGPFRGSLMHHGWVATSVRLPAIAPTIDSRVLAPAEVELT